MLRDWWMPSDFVIGYLKIRIVSMLVSKRVFVHLRSYSPDEGLCAQMHWWCNKQYFFSHTLSPTSQVQIHLFFSFHAPLLILWSCTRITVQHFNLHTLKVNFLFWTESWCYLMFNSELTYPGMSHNLFYGKPTRVLGSFQESIRDLMIQPVHWKEPSNSDSWTRHEWRHY